MPSLDVDRLLDWKSVDANPACSNSALVTTPAERPASEKSVSMIRLPPKKTPMNSAGKPEITINIPLRNTWP